MIPNKGKPDFRDPKVFFNPVKNCYSLVLAAGSKVEFYSSENLKDWEKQGILRPASMDLEAFANARTASLS